MTTVYPSTFFKKSGVFSTLYKLHVSRHIEKTDPETTRDEKTYFSANATPRAREYEAPTVARAPATQHHSHHDAYPDADAETARTSRHHDRRRRRRRPRPRTTRPRQ